jgi:hypothetical protein
MKSNMAMSRRVFIRLSGMAAISAAAIAGYWNVAKAGVTGAGKIRVRPLSRVPNQGASLNKFCQNSRFVTATQAIRVCSLRAARDYQIEIF